MSQESTTPDLVELVGRQLEAVNRRDLDAVMSFCPPDGVYDVSPSGLGVFERPVAIRGFLKDWWDAGDVGEPGPCALDPPGLGARRFQLGRVGAPGDRVRDRRWTTG